MKNINKIIGIVGAVLLIFSLVYYSITNIWDTLNWISFIVGILGIGYFVYDYYKNREKKLSKRNLQYGSNVIVQIVIVIGIVALIAFITTRQQLRIDWTEKKLNTLSDQSEKILFNLDKDVKIIAFYRESNQEIAKFTLDKYLFESDYINIEYVDPDQDPQIANKYQIKQINSVVIEAGSKKEIIEELTESNVTNAIMKVTREVEKTIYFLTGHGERSISQDDVKSYKKAAEAIKKENYIVKELNLVRRIAVGKGVPDSCTVLAIVQPKSNFFPQELDSIKSYVDKGGKLLVMLDPERGNDIADFFNNYHVEVGNNMVVDASGMGQLFGAGPAMPLVSNYDNSIPITKDFNVMTFYPQTCSIIPQQDKGGYNIKELLKTSGNSWAEVDFANREVGFNEGRDIPGPVTIAVLIEKSVADKKLGIALFGDSDFASNGYWQYGNPDLFLNTINYLAEEEDLISIRPIEVDDRRVTLTQAEVSTIFYLVVIAIPLLVIIAGVVFYIKRGK